MRKNFKNYKRICTLLIMSLLIGSTPGSVTYGANSLKLYSYETKKTTTYKDKQISYVINGKTIDLGNTPGILSDNGVALGSYIHVFQKTLGLKCSLNKSTKKITISDGDTTLTMTVGSKKAYVNGKAVTMNAAPVTYKYVSANKALTLVPTRFVAETFGYNYNWNSSTSTVTITKPLKLNYDNKDVTYTGVTGKVVVDGKNINVTTLPTILISNTAMVQAWKVFAQSMGVTYKINNSTNEITFTKGNITVEMKLGSTSATINGTVVDCGVAPRYVTNLDNNKEFVLVPGQFLAKALGYDYSWSDKTQTSTITTTSSVGESSKITPTPTVAPTLTPTPTPSTGGSGNSGSIPAEKTNYFTWSTDDKYKTEVDLATKEIENYNAEQTITTDSTNDTSILSIYRDSSIQDVFYETFVVSLLNAPSAVTATKKDDNITLSIKNAIINEQAYYVDSQLVSSVSVSSDSSTSDLSVNFKLNNSGYFYTMKLSEDGTSIIVTVYPNYLTKVTGGKDTTGSEFISLNSINDMNVEVTDDNYYVYLNMPDSTSTMDEMQYATDSSTEVSFVFLETTSKNSSQLVIQKPFVGAEYSVKKDKNQFYLSFEENQTSTVDSDTVAISLPSGVTASSISDEDQYYNKQIVISLSGNYVDYYKANPIITNHERVTSVSVKYEGGKTKIIIKTSKIQGYALDYGTNQLNVKIANPSEMYQKIVVLDAGHGGNDPGTMNGSTKEKDIVFNILNNYAKDYFENSDIKIYYTRIDDTRIDLYERAGFAKQVEADLFVSLHVNSATSTAARGTNVYYTAANKAALKSGLDSKKLATLLVNNLSRTLGTNNRGIVNGNFVVISKNSVPSVLIELAFLSNPSDYQLLINKDFQKKAAKCIFDTIDAALKSYPTGR